MPTREEKIDYMMNTLKLSRAEAEMLCDKHARENFDKLWNKSRVEYYNFLNKKEEARKERYKEMFDND